MKKIALLLSIVSLLVLTACGSATVEDEAIIEENTDITIEDTTSDVVEMSEEEVDALFEEMMQQANEELSMEAEGSMEAETSVDDMPYVESNGELNPGMTE